MKNRVLQMIGSFHQGGSERQAVQLTKLLHDSGEFELFAATLDKSGRLLSEIESLSLPEVREFRLRSFYDANFVRQLWRFAAYLRANKIQLVHTHDFYTNVFGILAARLARVPVRIASKRETEGMRSPLQERIERWIFGRSDRVTVNSKAVERFLVDRKVDGRKISVIYNGVDLPAFGSGKADVGRIRESFGLPSDPKIRFVTLVANLRHRVKNHEMLLRAAQNVGGRVADVHFVLAGEGALKPELEKFAASLGVNDRVHFIGACTRVGDLLSISSLGVLTSDAEGFSNAIVEYMAAGLPVVATDVGGAAEVIRNGETGYLVNPGDDEGFTERLVELLSDDEKAERFGRLGKSVVEDGFSTTAQLNAISELYRSCLKSRNVGSP